MKALSSEKKFIKVGSCHKLPFKDSYFDFIISISTIHHLAEKKISQSIKEIERVKEGKSFIRVKGYKNLKEKKFIDDWNLVAKSNLSIKKWKQMLKKSKYTGDFDFSNF